MGDYYKNMSDLNYSSIGYPALFAVYIKSTYTSYNCIVFYQKEDDASSRCMFNGDFEELAFKVNCPVFTLTADEYFKYITYDPQESFNKVSEVFEAV